MTTQTSQEPEINSQFETVPLVNNTAIEVKQEMKVHIPIFSKNEIITVSCAAL
jgi:hypothetical protein